MFGKYNVKEIVEGWKNDFLDREQELGEKRLKICKECLLYTDDGTFGPKCDSSKYYNTITGELVDGPGENVVRGCSCPLLKKTKSPNSHCIIGKW